MTSWRAATTNVYGVSRSRFMLKCVFWGRVRALVSTTRKMNRVRLNAIALCFVCVGWQANCVSQELVQTMSVVGDSFLQTRQTKATDFDHEQQKVFHNQNELEAKKNKSLLQSRWIWTRGKEMAGKFYGKATGRAPVPGVDKIPGFRFR